MKAMSVEIAQRLATYLFSLSDDEELLTLTVSALNSVAERDYQRVLPALLSSHVRLVEEVQERLKTTADEVRHLSFLSVVVAFKAFCLPSLP